MSDAVKAEQTVRACPDPECDTSKIAKRVKTDDYKCYVCGKTFDEPNTRPPREAGRTTAVDLDTDDNGGGRT